MDDGRRLAELFVALFGSERELRRFVTLELPKGAGHGRKSVRSESLSTAAPEVATALVAEGFVTPALFAALTKHFPGRVADIERVRAFYLESVEQRAVDRFAGPGGEVPAKYAAVVQELRDELDELELPPDAAELATTSPDHWPWAAAAAVLGGFRPLELQPLPPVTPSSPPAIVALAELVLAGRDGEWVLRDDVRARCLRRLWDEDLLTDAMDENTTLPDTRRELLRQLLDRGLPPLTHLDSRDLDDLDVVLGWLQPFDERFVEYRVAVQAAVERRILIDPLRALVGRHFRGRERELATVTTYLDIGDPPRYRDPVLVVTGPGGSGKSTLLGKLLLDLEDHGQDDSLRPPFAYIDFDKARHDPRSPRALLEQVARQLQLLYATSDQSEQLALVEGIYSRDEPFQARQVRRALDLAQDAPVADLAQLLADALHSIASAEQGPLGARLILVFDTFEEVIRKGPGAVRDVWDLIDALRAAIRGIRVVVAGRGVIETPGDGRPPLELGDLDPVAADAVLAQLGVADPDLRHLVIEQYGGNPLTLRLAAEAIARTGSAAEAFHGIERRADILAEVAQEQVQGMLYSRVLGHLRDLDVVKVAHPGLVVRRITVPVLRHVLAGPCGLDPDAAEDIFERLRREATMFDLENGDTLRHRQDVRRLMLRTIYDDPKRAATVAEIHRLAIEHYRSGKGHEARAEELYHRLMAGEDPRTLDKRWSRDLADLLDSALEEPLPPRARTWLGRRVGLLPGSDSHDWDQADWEAGVESAAASWLASNQPHMALELLGQRPGRLPGSRLYPLEIEAWLALGDADRASQVLLGGMTSAVQARDQEAQLALAEQAVVVHARLGNAPGVVDSGEAAESLADLVGEPNRGLKALSSAVTELRGLGVDAAADAMCARLTDRFTHLSRDQLRAEPELVRTVLHAAGPLDATVIRHAAAEVGDETDEVTGVFNRDPYALSRLLEQVTHQARPALHALADEVGLGGGRWDTPELASFAVRAGRTGKAVTLGLDYASDPAAARELVVDGLVRPVDAT